MTRLGIYGGTFSPPHIGHIEAARAFCEQMRLDRLMIIPTNIPPHKSAVGKAPAEDRLNMCALSFEGVAHAEVSDMEIRRAGTSFTYLTLEELTAPDRELFFLCGTDMILTMDEWRYPERIFALATVCYMRRETDAQMGEQIAARINEYREKYGARIVEISAPPIRMSSSEVRATIEGGGDASGVMEARTLGYIRERGLYR